MNNKQRHQVLFNTDTNIIGGVPDYSAVIKFVLDELGPSQNTDFVFRTQNASQRFVNAIKRLLIEFKNDAHKKIFIDAISNDTLRLEQKYLMLFWQFNINNPLFNRLTEDYYMKCLFAGRSSLSSEEVTSLLYELRRENPDELQWSEATLKLTASKYLTVLKKLGLAEGTQNKSICYPVVGDEIFVYFVKLALAVYPEQPTEANPLFKLSFLDTESLIKRLKTIKFTSIWTLKQLGNNIQIELA